MIQAPTLVIGGTKDQFASEEYNEYVGYIKASQWGPASKYYYPAAERQYYVGFRYTM